MTRVAKHKGKVVKRLQHHERKRRLHVPPAIAPNTINALSMTQPMVDRLFWRAGFGPSGEGYFRLSAFNSRSNVEEALARIRRVF